MMICSVITISSSSFLKKRFAPLDSAATNSSPANHMHLNNAEENWTFEELVHRQHTALLVIDLQKDFCDDDGAMAKLGKDLSMIKGMLPRLVSLVEAARVHNIKIISRNESIQS